MIPKAADYGLIAASFFASIGGIMLLVMMRGSPAFFSFGWSESALLAWDAGLSFLFFLQHSGMVRRSFRERTSGCIPERFQGAVFAVASGIVLGIVAVFWQHSGTTLLTVSGLPRVLMRAVGMLSFAVFLLSFIALRSFDMLGTGPIRAHLRGRVHRPGTFMVRGPYRWVRHPIYTSLIVLFWTNPDLTSDRLLFNILWSGWMVVATRLEERDLAHEFGDAYARYQEAVPMLVPRLTPAPPV